MRCRLGAWPMAEGGCQFRVWAPKAQTLELLWWNRKDRGEYEVLPESFLMEKNERGYYELILSKAGPGDRYKFRLDNKAELPDPSSRFQPEGPHGSSEILTDDFGWTDREWKGLNLSEIVIYELHVGCFSSEGTFEGVEKQIYHLKNLGINAIEIMPVAQFAGGRNWGYDGVGLFAVQNTYGEELISPLALKRLVNSCHQAGLAVILDVVYNHLGPEGNYLPQFGSYFQSKYKTPWGEAINFDGEGSDEVRNYFLENARQWFEDFHIDGLRLDAVHAIIDSSAMPFLEELARTKSQWEKDLKRRLWLIAESDANDSRILSNFDFGGLGLDAQWADDLHHIVHSLLTGEKQAYYEDYGELEQLAEIYRGGVYFQGAYSPSRKRSHGRSYEHIERSRLVVCSQNHDQIGNRKDGDRLLSLVGPEKQKMAAACVLLSPCLPLIFMGEEIAEKNPFLYFIDHTDEELRAAVQKGRKEEFSGFSWSGEVPDPAAIETFNRSKLNWGRVNEDPLTKEFMLYYRRLIALSKWIRKEKIFDIGWVKTTVFKDQLCLKVETEKPDFDFIVYFSFSPEPQQLELGARAEGLEVVIDSSECSHIFKDKIDLQPYSAAAIRGA